MSVLITGACGFIGSAVTRHLVQKYPDQKFIGLDKLSYCSNAKNLDKISELDNFELVIGDLTDAQFMEKLFDQHSVQEILHFAAYTHVCHSFGNSLTFTHNNVHGTHLLLEHARRVSVKKFIHVSTDEVYGDQDGVSKENSLLDPTNPYAATKAAAEMLVKSYGHSFGLPVIITRGNNVYGPFQYPEKVVPRFCLRLHAGQKCQIQGSGTQTRSFLYIDDVARAFETIWTSGQIGETYNIGTDRQISISQLATQLVSEMYPGEAVEKWIDTVDDRDFNDQRYLISSAKLEALGWKPEVDFETGLKLTLQWYQNHRDHWPETQLKKCLDCNTQALD